MTGHSSVPNLEYLKGMKDHLRAIKQNVPESSPDQNAEDGGEKDKVGYLSLAERPIAFPGEPFQEKKSGNEPCQIGSAIPTDTNIPVESDQKWVEVMNVEREPHRRHERSGAAQEFKEFEKRSREPESRSQEAGECASAWRGAALSFCAFIVLQQAAPGNLSWLTMSERVWRALLELLELLHSIRSECRRLVKS